MNQYENQFGCASPNETKIIFESLEAAGFAPIDTSWHNDANDSVEVTIKDKKYRVWVGDPENPDECYQRNSLVQVAENAEEDIYILPKATIEEITSKLIEIKNT